ncbi:MAG: hypothetical protein G01um101438_856 [Parcubacteria group bacterium Gr01-1014_38]|nr:MAG: hypothetical protein G01um101438_856 [Parcubacteria group bacterium Gr01-1014_38]
MSRGILTLVFDDGYQEVFDQVLPLLQQHGIRATFAVPVETERVAQPEGVTIASLGAWKDACRREGHELAAHGVTHRPLTVLNDAELERELQESRAATGATTLVYPGGTFDDRVKRSAARMFRAARTTAWGIESLPSRDPYALRTLTATGKNFHWWKFFPRELQSMLINGWTIETFHRVTERPTHLHDVSLRDFARHLAWLRHLPLRIATIREVMHAGSP